MNWREYPFVRLLLPFVGGIILSFSFPDNTIFIRWIPFVLILVLGWLTLRRGRYRYRWGYGTVLMAFLFLLGYVLGSRHDQSFREHHFGQFIEKENEVLAVVKDKAKTANSFRLLLDIQAIKNDGHDTAAIGKLLAYVQPDSLVTLVKYGDQIHFQSFINPIDGRKNPKAFDLSRYWSNQNVFHQTYLKSGTWHISGYRHGNRELAFALSVRQRFADILAKHLGEGKALAVANALILGKKDLLDRAIKSAYSDTGAMHVLAVSGLHVGLICYGISLVLGLFPFKSTRWVWVKTWIMVAGVWFFAFLTGAAPSVLRAATMFSFLVVGNAMRHHPSIYNTLAASAFVLLCFNPFMIREVGFQLSYLAVTGIIYFQPILYRNVYIANPVLNYIWKLTSVSLAAQIGTLPITLFYFHQFPVYFWLSGLVVIPAATLILASGMLLFFLEMTIPALAFIPAFVLHWSLFITNGLVEWISTFPGAVLDGFWISPLTLMILFLAISMLILTINTQKTRWIQGMAVVLLLLAINVSANKIHQFHQSGIVIYHHRKELLIDYFTRDQLWSIRSATITENDIAHTAKNNRNSIFTQTLFYTYPPHSNLDYCWKYQHGLLQFKNITLQIIHQNIIPQYFEKIKVDYLLLSKCHWTNLEEVLERVETPILLIGADNPAKRIQQWKAICSERGIDVYDVGKAGSFWIEVED